MERFVGSIAMILLIGCTIVAAAGLFLAIPDCAFGLFGHTICKP